MTRNRLFVVRITLLLFALTGSARAALMSSETKITASDAAAGASFGGFVAISGDTVVVGAALDSEFGFQSGSAYVFVRSGTNWTQQAKLTASDASTSSFFGNVVGISGDTIVVGAYGDNGNTGAAYVFVRSGTNWTQQAKLTASDAAADNKLGTGIDISGDTVVVSSIGSDDVAPGNVNCDSGAAYVFVRSGTVWTQQARLTASDAACGSRFAQVVGINGDSVIVGAPFHPVATKSGAAYVFVRSGTAWSEQKKLTASDAAAGDRFGNAVAIDTDTVVVGARADNNDTGSAYVFVRSGTTWSQQQKLTATDAALGDSFGFPVGLSGARSVVGAYGNNTNAGAAYVFVRSGIAWTQQAKLTASDAAADDFFGAAAGISGETVVVGASGNDDAGLNSGSAYVYDLAACQLDVPYFNQCDLPWKTNTYDKSAKTICSKGCAMTCVSMSLNFLGVTQLPVGGLVANNDPGTLNQFMLDHPGDFSGSDVNWGPTTRDASSKLLVWNQKHIDAVDADGFTKATNFFESAICVSGFPVIVKVDVDLGLKVNPGHFVLVTGKDKANNFIINDPRHSDWHSLTNYNNRFKTRGFLSPRVTAAAAPLAPASAGGQALAVEDIGALYVGVAPHAQLFVTDPNGHRTGIVPATTNELEEISQSVQFTDELTDDETGDPPTESTHFVYIDRPTDGDYQIQVTGLAAGPFELTIRAFARDGSTLPPVLIEGFVEAGATTNLNFSFSGATPEAHDLAVVKMKAPKKITLSATVTNANGKFSVSIQNRSAHSEVIADMTMLSNLVTLAVQSLGACPDVTPVMLPPKGTFPITLLPKKKLTLAFTAAFDCYNDPLATTKTAAHSDFRIVASVHHDAIDGNADTHTADDNCPRAPLPGGTDSNPDPSKPLKDTGCAGGVDVKTDVFIKQ